VEQWLLGGEDAPSDSRLWGSKRPTYAKLEELVWLQEKGTKSKKKGKKRQDDSSSSEVSIKKEKNKKKVLVSKKGSSSKSNRL
jgi:hypothetical protein